VVERMERAMNIPVFAGWAVLMFVGGWGIADIVSFIEQKPIKLLLFILYVVLVMWLGWKLKPLSVH
jgi:hypothetical protein